MSGTRRWLLVGAITTSAALMLAGCTSNTESSGPSDSTTAVTPTKVEAIANMVPEKIRNAGKLVIGTDPTYAPNEYKGAKGIVGFDIDMMNAVAAVLGLSTEYRESSFDSIIPSVVAGTYDVGVSSFTDTKERENQVDFVTYFKAGSLWAQRPGPPIDPNNACGLKVAVQAKTTQEETELPAKSAACVAAGKPPIQVVKFDGQDLATNAVILGQADAMTADSPVTTYAIKQSAGKLEAAGEIFESAPYGWAVTKGSPLGPVLLKALEHLMQTGDYKTIATNWGAQQGMIDKPVINGAVS